MYKWFAGICNLGDFGNQRDLENVQLREFLLMVGIWRICNGWDFENYGDFELSKFWTLLGFSEFQVLWGFGELAIAGILRNVGI